RIGGLFFEPVRLTPHRVRVEYGFHVAELGRQFRDLSCRVGACHGGKPTRGRGGCRTIGACPQASLKNAPAGCRTPRGFGRPGPPPTRWPARTALSPRSR